MFPVSLSHTAAVALLGASIVCPVCLPDTGSGSGSVVFVGSPTVGAAAADTLQVRLDIEGMTCGSCVTTARIVLERTSGVIDAEVSYEESAATVLYDEALTSVATIIARLEKYTGYVATEAEPIQASAP